MICDYQSVVRTLLGFGTSKSSVVTGRIMQGRIMDANPALIDTLESNVPHPGVSDLIFWPQDGDEPTAEQSRRYNARLPPDRLALLGSFLESHRSDNMIFKTRPRLRRWRIVWFAAHDASFLQISLPRRGHRLFGNVDSFW